MIVLSGIATYEGRKVLVEPGVDRYGSRIVRGFVVVGFMISQGVDGVRRKIGN